TATGLQWEKKDGAGDGPNTTDLHDVDNLYSWAGRCTVNAGKPCRPTAAAEALCQAQTAVAYWAYGCQQCTGEDGTCNVDPFGGGAITTVWEWLDQVRTANFAGHSDWRLPSEDGCNSCYTGPPDFKCPCASSQLELETILLASPCPTNACIAAIFGP